MKRRGDPGPPDRVERDGVVLGKVTLAAQPGPQLQLPAPRWRITVSVPGTGPRILTAIETGTGRCVQARDESELEARLTAEPAQPAGTSS